MRDSDQKTSPVILALAWLMVLIPLTWGVYKSVITSLPLFGIN
jgi:hypothetical protein